MTDRAAASPPRFPLEPKVKAAGGTASAAAAAVQFVLHLLFRHGGPPVWLPYVSHVIADGGLAALAGYKAPHQHRDPPVARSKD